MKPRRVGTTVQLVHTLELNFEYAEAPFVAPIDEDIQPLNPDISHLQKECEDFKAIYHYLQDQILPDDEKFAKFVVCEANQYELKDGTLYHLFQNNDNLDHMILQLVVPKVKR